MRTCRDCAFFRGVAWCNELGIAVDPDEPAEDENCAWFAPAPDEEEKQ